jgi:predicted RNase H-like HicB family nuclease
MHMKYKVVLNKTDEGYSVHCPGLPGCWSQGDTEAEAIENIKDAVTEYLAALYDSILFRATTPSMRLPWVV